MSCKLASKTLNIYIFRAFAITKKYQNNSKGEDYSLSCRTTSMGREAERSEEEASKKSEIGRDMAKHQQFNSILPEKAP